MFLEIAVSESRSTSSEDGVLGTVRSQQFIRLLLAYPTSGHIVATDFDTYVWSAWETVGRAVGNGASLTGVSVTARQSVALPNANEECRRHHPSLAPSSIT